MEPRDEPRDNADGTDALTQRLKAVIDERLRNAEDRTNQTLAEAIDKLAETPVRAPVPERERSKPVQRDQPWSEEVPYRFSRMEIREGIDDLYERDIWARDPIFKRTRNPRLDEGVKRWLELTHRGYREQADRLCAEINDDYLNQRAALLEGTADADSGLAQGTGVGLVPLPLSTNIVTARNKASKMRRIVSRFPMQSQTQRIPNIPVVTADTRAENVAYSDATPGGDDLLLTSKLLGVLFSASGEFLQDAAINIVSLLTERAGSAIGQAEDVQIWQSTGATADFTEGLYHSTAGTGMAAVTTCAITTNSSTSGVAVYADVVALYYGVSEPYRREAAYFATGPTLEKIAALQSTNGNPILQGLVNAPVPFNDVDPDAAGRIFGKPVYEVPIIDDDLLVFGNPLWYAFGERTGIMVRSDVTVTTNLTQWVIEERVDGRTIPTLTSTPLLDSWRYVDFS